MGEARACWTRARDLAWTIPSAVRDGLITITADGMSNGPNAPAADDPDVRTVVEASAGDWIAIGAWGKETGNLSPWQCKFAQDYGRQAGRGRQPTAKQATQLVRILRHAQSLGFTLDAS